MTRQGQARALITGGAGFVGCNLAAALLDEGCLVRLLDDLSRPGVERNLRWLTEHYGDAVDVLEEDLATTPHLDRALDGVDQVYHFAAQVAVTTSLEQPELDFRTNLLGTFRLLEALRHLSEPPPLVFASTNKVYGDLGDIELEEQASRYASPDLVAVNERQPLDFHTPYGCSKGGADQYVLDYARCYRLPATVLRMSCIYGPHQCGTEDQGWVAHFLIQALNRAPIHIFGNGKQVRDILFVDDLVRAQRTAVEHIHRLGGRAWNIGGGPDNSVSLLEVLELIEAATGSRPQVEYRPPRAGDQRYYVSDVSAFGRETGWRPRVGPREGVEALTRWFQQSGLVAEGDTLDARAVGGR